MSDVLQKIIEHKRAHIAARKIIAPLAQLEERAHAAEKPRGFASALRRTVQGGGLGLIAEIKKASPSKGLIRPDFDVASLARAYEQGGATCLSVLTDEPYFQGKDAYLETAKQAAALPALRKDFMLDLYQVVEARALGADCILLIMAALSVAEAKALAEQAQGWGMDVLIEVHNAAELDQALAVPSDLVGVNNRNLKTLQVDLQTTVDLAPRVPKDRMLVAESGIDSRADLARMAAAGASCFLIGESFMRQQDVAQAVRKLFGAAA
ncbi:MAG: indole-3-glycerol phosphate synthase TrpC [Rhodospirillales bacterium]